VGAGRFFEILGRVHQEPQQPCGERHERGEFQGLVPSHRFRAEGEFILDVSRRDAQVESIKISKS